MCIYRDTGIQMLFGLDLELSLIFTPVNFEVSGAHAGEALNDLGWEQQPGHNVLVTITVMF